MQPNELLEKDFVTIACISFYFMFFLSSWKYILIKLFTSRNRQLTRHVSVNILREDDPGGHRQAATLTVTYSASHATPCKQ